MPERVELQSESWIEVRNWLVGHGRIRVPGLAARVGQRIEVRLSLPSGLAVGFTGDVIDPAGGLVEIEARGQGDLELLVVMAESEVDAERLATVLNGPPRPRAGGERRAAGAAGTPTPTAGSREVIQPRKARPSVVVPELDLAAVEPVARRVETSNRPPAEELGIDGFAVELEPALSAELDTPEPTVARPRPVLKAEPAARPEPAAKPATMAARPEPERRALELEASLDFGSLGLEPLDVEPPPVDLGDAFEMSSAPPPVDLGDVFQAPAAPPAPEPGGFDFSDSLELGDLPDAPAAPGDGPELDSVDIGGGLGFGFDPPVESRAEPAHDQPAEDEFDVDLSSVDLPPAPLAPSLLDVRQVGAAALLVDPPADEADEPLSGGPVLGIAFGTTRAEVAIVSGHQAFLATDAEDNPGVPAKVQIPARDRQGKDVSIVVSGMKRLLGRRADDPTNSGWLAQQPWRTTSVDGLVAVQLGGGAFAVPRLLAEVLKRLKQQAATALGDQASDAVIAVPLAYDAVQRAGLRQAARLAGLRVVGLIPEPVAAALAFGLGKARREISLVFDLGGGTLDVTVLEGQGERFRVLAAVSDPWLGGDDFDRALATDVLRSLNPIARGAVDQAGLLTAAEVTKRALSTASDSVLTIPVLAGQPRQLKIDRVRLAASAAGLLAQAQGALDRVLADAGLTASAVQQILLVGGMARSPMVRELVGERFGRAFTQVVGPDEAVALGAAIQGVALARPRRR